MSNQPQNNLFRQQALAARTTKFTGKIMLAQPVPTRVAAWTAAGIMAGLALLLTCGHYTKKIHVAGALAPAAGSVRIVATQIARVTRRLVSDNQKVKAGQALFELSSERAGSDGEIERQLDTRMRERAQSGALQAEELQQNRAALADRQRVLEADIASRSRALALQGQVVMAAHEKRRRYRSLAKEGFVSAASVSDASAAMSEQMARMEELKSNLLSAQRDLLAVREQARGIDLKLRQINSAAGQDLAGLKQEAADHAGRTRISVTAPIDGMVTAIAPDIGQAVSVGAPLATILPTGSALEARLMVPARAVTYVEPGQGVRMRLDGVPYTKFGPVTGIVEHVDRSPSGTNDAGVLYRVTVRLDHQSITMYGRERPFSDGMTLDADILQDRRSLIEWLFEPLISATKDRAP